VFLPYVEMAIAESGLRDVVLAGGVFGNVKLTQRILEMPSVGKVFVHPAMNDHGIAVGAGLEYLARRRGARPTRLPHVFLGPDHSDEECIRALDEAGLRYREERDIESCVAALLAAGKVVARFAGRMEYGPRALGNRSILYRSDDSSVNDWLNRMLRRREYMPFAPATLSEAAAECYGDLTRATECVRFMTVAVPCSEYMRRTSPGAVHIDGTARPQVVWEEDNPSYYRILRLYAERSGIPSVINTSFNMHEEPIVCTPGDACRAFVAAGLPYLAMNRFLVLGPRSEFRGADHAARYAGAARGSTCCDPRQIR
jgi:carbamoyltransferase